MINPETLYRQIQLLILLFISFLVLSGVTAFFVESGLRYLIKYFPIKFGVENWLIHVQKTLSMLNKQYPFISYGYDWLAFGHLIIALFFIGVYHDPLKNNWVIKYGMIACIAIFPTAFIAGFLRGIPPLWQLIDCSFGFFGLILLYIIDRKTKCLEKQLTSP